MRQLIIRHILLLAMLCFLLPVRAQEPVVDGDTLIISLLTCEPHDEVYSLYGHTALRFRSTSGKMDWAVNYGVFDYNTPNFAMRFVLGKTDYILGVFPFHTFQREYDSYGSSIHEQMLNLTKTEKERIYAAMYNNALPENREYRYNFFYDNCTTRARDLIVKNIKGKVIYNQAERTDKPTTYREWVHRYNGANVWTCFGSDLLLGIAADRQITDEQAQFLPDNLMKDFARAVIVDDAGAKRPFVAETQMLPSHHPPMKGGSFPLRPRTCAMLILAAVIVCALIEQKRHRWLWGCDVLLIVLTGLAGIVLTLMIFSQHPTVNLNLQLLVLNPLPLLFAWPALRRRKQRQPHWMWTLWTVLLIVGLIGSFFQHYAEGLGFIICACLIRSVMGMKLKKMTAS